MRIGLALSGGAARGIAHIGVLKYLEEREIKPCCVAGTSAGSIVGAMYCSGMTAEDIEVRAKEISWKDLIKISIPRKGLLKSSRLLQILKEEFGEMDFSDLKIPLYVNTVDLLKGEEVVISEGPVAEAVQASCAIPGIFTPVKFGDQICVDGGLLDNLPVTVIKNKKADFILAVDVGAQKPLQKEPESIFEVLIQSFYVIQRHRDLPAHEHADLIIEPSLGDIAMWDMTKIDLLIERGYSAAKEILGSFDTFEKKGLFARWFGREKK